VWLRIIISAFINEIATYNLENEMKKILALRASNEAVSDKFGKILCW